MADQYGLTNSGFVPMQVPEIQSDLQDQVRLQFGNVDLSDQSVFGQLIGIFAASSAQLWQAGAALYTSSYPGGATGGAVDNLLALNNLTRLPEAATVTNPTPVTRTDGVILYGFRILGTPGTVVPAGALFSNGAPTPTTFSLDSSVAIGAPNNARQVLYFTGVANAGSYTLTLTDGSGNSATTAAIPYNAQSRVTLLQWSSAPSASYALKLGSAGSTTSIAANATAAQVQAAIAALSGYSGVAVSGTVTAGIQIIWPAGFVPVVTATGSGAPQSILQAVSSYVHGLTSGSVQPFTDVLLTDGPQNTTFDFGAFAPQTGQPSTGAVAIPRLSVLGALTNGNQQVPVNPKVVVVGNPAQASCTATCTSPGPNAVLAGQLTSIATPVSGLTSCVNDLDCLTGRDAESDSDAITRFQSLLGSSASGSLGSITKQVSQLQGVTQVAAFQNTGNAAGQVLLFASAPTSGAFSLVLGGQTTASLAYNATSAQVQAAVRALTGFSGVLVSSYGSTGYQFDFAGVRGSQALPLIAVAQNSTQVALTPYYGRPPHSVELVVEGGTDLQVAQAILASLPAGVATYSNPTLRTTATLTQGQTSVPLATAVGVSVGQTIEASGLPVGAQVVAINESTITASASATASGSLVPIAFTYSPLLKDSAGNVLSIGFSRPQSVLVYVSLSITTDVYISPGDKTSGLNSAAQWDPSYVAGIQQGIIDIINAVPIGGTLTANGTNSLDGSFRAVPGVAGYSIAFGTSPNPTGNTSVSFQSNQAPTAQSYSVVLTYV